MGVRRWVAGVLCLPLLVLSACSDDDSEPDSEPSESITLPTPTESKTPDGPVEPVEPAAMAGKDAAAAKAFVKYYWAVANYAQVSGDTDRLRELGHDLCKPCSAGVDSVDEVYQAGGRYKGGKVSISHLKATQLQSGNVSTYAVDFDYRSTRLIITPRRGAKSNRQPGASGRLRLLVRSDSNGAWQINQWSIL